MVNSLATHTYPYNLVNCDVISKCNSCNLTILQVTFDVSGLKDIAIGMQATGVFPLCTERDGNPTLLSQVGGKQ